MSVDQAAYEELLRRFQAQEQELQEEKERNQGIEKELEERKEESRPVSLEEALRLWHKLYSNPNTYSSRAKWPPVSSPVLLAESIPVIYALGPISTNFIGKLGMIPWTL